MSDRIKGCVGGGCVVGILGFLLFFVILLFSPKTARQLLETVKISKPISEEEKKNNKAVLGSFQIEAGAVIDNRLRAVGCYPAEWSVSRKTNRSDKYIIHLRLNCLQSNLSVMGSSGQVCRWEIITEKNADGLFNICYYSASNLT